MNPSNKKPKQPTPFPLAAGFPEQCTNWSKPQGERLDGNENKKSKLSNLRLVRSSRAWRRKASTAWNGDGDMLIMLILLIQLSCWINAKILVNFLAGQPIKLKNQLYNKWSKSLRVKCVWGGPESLQIDGQRSTFHSSVMTNPDSGSHLEKWNRLFFKNHQTVFHQLSFLIISAWRISLGLLTQLSQLERT